MGNCLSSRKYHIDRRSFEHAKEDIICYLEELLSGNKTLTKCIMNYVILLHDEFVEDYLKNIIPSVYRDRYQSTCKDCGDKFVSSYITIQNKRISTIPFVRGPEFICPKHYFYFPCKRSKHLNDYRPTGNDKCCKCGEWCTCVEYYCYCPPERRDKVGSGKRICADCAKLFIEK